MQQQQKQEEEKTGATRENATNPFRWTRARIYVFVRAIGLRLRELSERLEQSTEE